MNAARRATALSGMYPEGLCEESHIRNPCVISNVKNPFAGELALHAKLYDASSKGNQLPHIYKCEKALGRTATYSVAAVLRFRTAESLESVFDLPSHA